MGKALPIAQAYTVANGTADAANTTDTLVTQSRGSHSTDRPDAEAMWLGTVRLGDRGRPGDGFMGLKLRGTRRSIP